MVSMCFSFLSSNKMTQCDLQKRFSRGFSLIELIIVISIATILTSISITTFFSVSEQQLLEKDVNYAIALVEKARLQTVNAKNNSQVPDQK